jgi:membrane-associated phospholipid phosphatase
MNLFQKHKLCWLKKRFWISVIFGILLIIISLVVNNYAQIYAANHVNNPESDIILDNIPILDVHLIYSEGAILFIIILTIVLLFEPKYIPFVFKNIAIFVITRSFFMILTHLAPPAAQTYINPTDYIQRLSHGDDLFFSGHTGLPFLMAIIFWYKKYLKWLFLACTLIGGTAVIFGHLHYSIDVFSALFISFGIFHICKFLFPKDYKFIDSL